MKKSLFAFFVSLSLALAGVSSLSKAGSLPVKAESEEAPRFENEVEADRNELAFTLTGSSLTPCSQSFTLSMQSVKIEAYNNSTRYNNVFVRIDDANYTDFQTAKKNAEDAQDAAESPPFITPPSSTSPIPKLRRPPSFCPTSSIMGPSSGSK